MKGWFRSGDTRELFFTLAFGPNSSHPLDIYDQHPLEVYALVKKVSSL